MKARRTGLVVEWVVEEDARQILLSSPPGTVCERSISSCRVEATARDQALGTEPSPPLAPSQGCEQETTIVRDDGATARGRALGTEPSPPLAPSQGCEQETTIARDDGATARGRALGTEPSPPLAPSQGCEQETTIARDDGVTARGRALGM